VRRTLNVSLPVNPRLAHKFDVRPEIGCEVSLERGGFGFGGAIDCLAAWVFAVPDIGVYGPVENNNVRGGE
jgi:hypothetical protein